MQAFADAGFYGIELLKRDTQPWQTVEGIEFRSVTVQAFKGKQGACFERNQAVIYLGPFREVLDDDGHRMERGVRYAVCDKTYQLYRKAPYARVLRVHRTAHRSAAGKRRALRLRAHDAAATRAKPRASNTDATTAASQCCDGGKLLLISRLTFTMQNQDKLQLLALDLTKAFPRSPRETLAGYVIAGRTLDKCRAVVAGTNGEYHYDCPLDRQFLGFTGIEAGAFKEFVATGATDAEVADWITAHSKVKDRAEIVQWNNKLRAHAPVRHVAGVAAFPRRLHPAVHPQEPPGVCLVRCL